MTSTLLRCAHYFGHYVKVSLPNDNKVMINLKKRYKEIYVMAARNVVSVPEHKEQTEINPVIDGLNVIGEYIEKQQWVQKKKIAHIINLINYPHTISDQQMLLLFNCCNEVHDCLPLDRVKLMESLWIILSICNYKMNISHYNALLKLYVENEYDFSPSVLLMEMKSKSTYPNQTTYEICIQYYCKKGDIQKALMLLQDMTKLRFPITGSIFNLFILGYSKSGNKKGVKNSLSTMKRKKVKLTTETYAAIMCNVATSNDVDKIEEIIKACNLNNIYFTNENILNVIYILAENKHNKSINPMYKYLKRNTRVLNNEIQILLKLISIDQIQVALNALLSMSVNSKHPQFASVLKIILEHMITRDMVVTNIIKLCTFIKSEKTFKEVLLTALHISLMKNDNLALSLLMVCKSHLKLKVHYFWPLLVKQGSKYDLQGILNIIKIMVDDFNLSPCIDTVSNYILPFMFGDVPDMRSLLMEHKISEAVINNAYVLLKLKKMKLAEAVLYMRHFEGDYYYDVLAHDLRCVATFKNNVEHFIYINNNLKERVESHPTSTANNDSHKSTFVSIDKQLCDFMIDFPSHKIWLQRVVNYLAEHEVNLNIETMKRIHNYFT